MKDKTRPTKVAVTQDLTNIPLPQSDIECTAGEIEEDQRFEDTRTNVDPTSEALVKP